VCRNVNDPKIHKGLGLECGLGGSRPNQRDRVRANCFAGREDFPASPWQIVERHSEGVGQVALKSPLKSDWLFELRRNVPLILISRIADSKERALLDSWLDFVPYNLQHCCRRRVADRASLQQ